MHLHLIQEEDLIPNRGFVINVEAARGDESDEDANACRAADWQGPATIAVGEALGDNDA